MTPLNPTSTSLFPVCPWTNSFFSLGWDSSSVEWNKDEEEASAGEIVKMQWNWQIKWLPGSKHSVCDDLVPL